MIEYSNPKVPDQVNVTKNSSIKDLVLLGLLAIGGLAALVFLIFFIGGVLGRLLPFEVEQWMVNQVDEELLTPATEGRSGALQDIADQLIPHMDFPEGMTVVVRYDPDPLVNAFATVGGQIIIMGGLIDRMESENELAMVIAHEMAHIKNRDVAAGLGGGILLALTYSIIFGDSSAGNLFGNAGSLMQLSFSRDAERQADLDAFNAVTSLYGHANGSVDLLEILRDTGAELPEGWADKVELLQTHPHVENRIDALEAEAKSREVSLTGPLTPLPSVFDREPPEGRAKLKSRE